MCECECILISENVNRADESRARGGGFAGDKGSHSKDEEWKNVG